MLCKCSNNNLNSVAIIPIKALFLIFFFKKKKRGGGARGYARGMEVRIDVGPNSTQSYSAN